MKIVGFGLDYFFVLYGLYFVGLVGMKFLGNFEKTKKVSVEVLTKNENRV